MRLSKKKLWMLVSVMFIGLTAFIVISPGQDRVMCLVYPQNGTQIRTISIELPERRHGELLEFLRDFSSSHNLLFAIDEYPAGAAGIAHRSYNVQSCNRFINITVTNTFEKNSFSVYISYFGDRPSRQFNEIENLLARGLQRFGGQ